jgi:hypothetical protein
VKKPRPIDHRLDTHETVIKALVKAGVDHEKRIAKLEKLLSEMATADIPWVNQR